MKSAQSIRAACSEVESDLTRLVPRIDLERVARFNAGYRHYEGDRYRYFVLAERRRFLRTIDRIASQRERGRVIDVGCFIPYVPLVLARLGYQVSVIDKYDFYGDGFKAELQALCDHYLMRLIDADILHDTLDIGQFEEVLCQAVIEHLNGSPRQLLARLRALLAPHGTLDVEVPNISEAIKRIRFLFGHSPFPAYADYFASEYPFFGHNREMTVAEVRYMLEASGFEIERLDCNDYTDTSLLGFKARCLYWARHLMPFRYGGELVSAIARVSNRTGG